MTRDPLLRLVALARPRTARFALGVLAGAVATGSAVALLAVSAWLIATAAQQPPITALSVAVVATRALGVTHAVRRTPWVAATVALPVVALVPAVLLVAGLPGHQVLAELLTVATAGYLVAYLLVCVAAPLFLRRIGELTRWAVVATGVVAPVLLVALGAFVAAEWGGAVPLVIAACAAGGLVWFALLRRLRPAELAGIGAYDETTRDDVLLVVP